MASLTRSTRQAEGFPPHHVNGDASLTRSGSVIFGSNRRTKRATDATDSEFKNLNAKKTRIAVEILAKPQAGGSRITDPRPAAAQAASTSTITNTKPALAPPPAAATPPERDTNVTKHQAKVISGIKHELDRLEPSLSTSTSREQGRKLRSQEATRFKSELSAYFPDYDEVIGNDPKEDFVLNLDTPIILADSNPRRIVSTTIQLHKVQPTEQFTVRGYGDALYTDVFDTQRIDLGFLEAQYRNKSGEDPLPDFLFDPIHKRAERLERSIRNSEKGRAQHEKDQIIRLLEGLQGHDWLRVMGVSGITETKKKSFEPAREYFSKGCQNILDKFKNWNLEEKRRKLEKERALAEQAEEEEEEEEGASEEAVEEVLDIEEAAHTISGENTEVRNGHEVDDSDMETSQDDTSEGSSPAKQLRQEAMARSRIAAARKQAQLGVVEEFEPPREFTSFFNKKYERDGALHRQRRAGRKVLAWGHPVPDITEVDFDLPEEYRDDETMRARARKKRRDKRQSRS